MSPIQQTKSKKQNKRKKNKKNLLMHMDEEIIYHNILRLCLYVYIQQEFATCHEQRISEKNSRQINCSKFVFQLKITRITLIQ